MIDKRLPPGHLVVVLPEEFGYGDWNDIIVRVVSINWSGSEFDVQVSPVEGHPWPNHWGHLTQAFFGLEELEAVLHD